jgi:hypothetical protein
MLPALRAPACLPALPSGGLVLRWIQNPACMASPQTSCHQESYRRTAPQARRERAAAAAASRQREARARGCVAQPRGDTAGIISG